MMKTRNKWLITAVILLIAGILICGITFVAMGFDFTGLSSGNYVTNTYEVTEEFRNISIDANTDDIVFMPSMDGKCSVVCYEDEKEPHEVVVEDQTLIINAYKDRKWYEFLRIDFQGPSITVYLPESEYEALLVHASTGSVTIPGDFGFADITADVSTGTITCNASARNGMKLEASTGDINAGDLSAAQISLSVTTGNIKASSITCEGDMDVKFGTGNAKLEDVTSKNLTTKGSTGDTSMKNVIVSEDLHSEMSTGDIRFDGCDAGTIYARTSTGDVEGSLLSDKVFLTETGTGDVEVPKTITGGKCEIITGTGDISIIIQ